MVFRRTIRPAAPEPPADPFAIPGNDGATRGPAPGCDACGSDSANRTLNVVGPDIVSVLCVDPHPCADRYRGGVSPATFAAGLRGEILAVAP